MTAAPTLPEGFPAPDPCAASQFAGLAHLQRIALEQAPASHPDPGSRAGDQIALLEAEMSAGKVPAPAHRRVMSTRNMLRSGLLMAAVLAVAAMLIPSLATAAERPAAGVHRYNVNVCGRSWVSVHIPRTSYFSIYNDDAPSNVTCIKPMQHRLDFQVETVNPRADNWDAYPNISSGWEWGRYTCTSHAGACYRYPVQERRDGTPRTSLAAWLAPGRYNLSYDCWFNRTDRKPEGQDNGTEVMIWLAHPGIGVWSIVRRVTIEGIRWDVMAWIAHHNGTSWHYVAFVAEHQRRSVSGLWLNPFFRNAIANGELSPSWWLTGIDAGFELVQGGVHDNIHYYTLTGLPASPGGR